MGRFRATIDDDDDDGQTAMQWEFVGANPDESTALCPRQPDDDAPPHRENETDQTQSLSPHGLSHASNAMGEWLLEQQRTRDIALRHEWEQEHKRKRRSCCNGSWLYVLAGVAILVAIWWKDPPPAPPSGPRSSSSTMWHLLTGTTTLDALMEADQPSTWTDFLLTHGHQFMKSAVALGIHTPRHILYWLGNSVVTDLELWYEDVKSSAVIRRIWRRSESSCTWDQALATDWDELIIGQPLAVEWLFDAVKAWVKLSNASASTGHEQALVVLATGYEHTGKRTLAYALMNQLYGNCTDLASTDAIFHVKGADWTLAAVQQEQSLATAQNLLFQKLAVSIESHVLRHRRSIGSTSATLLILVTNMEAMDVDILSRLVQALIVPPSTHDMPQPNLHELCRHSILYLTSDSVGIKAITRSLHLGRGNVRVVPGLWADVAHAVAHHFSSPLPKKSISILPFVPLTNETLPLLFRRRVAQFACPGTCRCRVHVTDAAVAHVLHDKRVEYLDWTLAPPRSNSLDVDQPNTHVEPPHHMKVVLDGASVLDDHGIIMTKLGAEMRPFVSQCQQSNVLVLDYDVRSVLESKRGVLHWCDDASDETKRQGCLEAHRFRI